MDPQIEINDIFLAAAEYIDSDHRSIYQFVQTRVGHLGTDVEKAHILYRCVRDEVRYDPYVDYTDLSTYRASAVLAQGKGYCVGKSALFCALCRAAEIPARIGLADVRNHLATARLLNMTRTDIFVLHGYVELYLDRRWVKATPTFDAALCRKLDVNVLEFNGIDDALLQPFSADGRTFMEYSRIHGTFFDVPAKFVMHTMMRCYPLLCRPGGVRGIMAKEV
ncbi:transglutaminase-like domain-containing protein [Pseudorhodoplanes sp.]|uniref:transglutaminase-like domain-containing protein n=1 Tax=Pseudorhodoplanes sp. TaxID=1934341 RepID=UPI003D11FBBE